MIAASVRFLNNSSLLVAFGGAALTFETFLITGASVDFLIITEVFFLTWLAYLFLRREKKTPHRKVLIISACTGCIVTLQQTNFIGWQILACSSVIVLIYNISSDFSLKISKFIPRQITFLKPAVVGMAWALTTSALPAIMAGEYYSPIYTVMFLSNFFFITALSICDDIRDMNTDRGHIRTLPMAIGIKNSKIVIIFHLLTATVIAFSTYTYHSDIVSIGFTGAMLMIILMVTQIHPGRNKDVQALMIDGSIMLRAMVTFILATYKYYITT